MRSLVLVVALGTSLFACASGDNLPGEDVDRLCPSADLGSINQLWQTEAASQAVDVRHPDGPKIHYVLGKIDDATTFEINLWDGYRPFEGPATPGSYEIGDGGTDLGNCGLCVFIHVNEHLFFATSGEVTINSIAGLFHGAASNLELEEVSLEAGNLVPNGCSASLGDISFAAITW